MKNKLFILGCRLSLVFTIAFLLIPIALLIGYGGSKIMVCLACEEVIFAIKMSMKTSIISTIFCIVIAIPTSYILNESNSWSKKVMTNMIYLPMALPHLVSGIALLLLFGRKGIGEWLYNTFGLDFIFTVNGIVLAQVFVNLPFTIEMILTVLEQTNEKMIFIARTLGCTQVKAFTNITLPNLIRPILSTIVMTWSRALGEFGAVIMVAGTTRLKTEILPTTIFLNIATGDIDIAMGVSTLLILISFACLLVFELIIPENKRIKKKKKKGLF